VRYEVFFKHILSFTIITMVFSDINFLLGSWLILKSRNHNEYMGKFNGKEKIAARPFWKQEVEF
jgi:hypothetical protein